MNKNLEKTFKYFTGTLAAYCALIGLLSLFTKDISWIINYTLLLTILGWMMFIQLKLVELKQASSRMTQRMDGVESGITALRTRFTNAR